MKKRILALVLCVALVAALSVGLVLGLAACNDKGNNNSDGKTLNVGAVYIGDAQETYTQAHIIGISAAIEELKKQGYTVNLSEKPSVGDEDVEKVHNAIAELVSWSKTGKRAGNPTIIITNSYGHQEAYNDIQRDNPDIQFVAMTGDQAAASGYENYHNAFNATYQSRYVAGVAAGYKLKELVDQGKLVADNYDNGNIKIGYVGAFPFAEVKSGYTAFYLGVKSIVSNVVMDVKFTNNWYTFDGEQEAANVLISNGCVIISQHADSAGAPTACKVAAENGKVVYNVGYNVSLKEDFPTVALTSATNNWSVFYTHAFLAVAKGEKLETDWSAGYEQGAVQITDINTALYTTDPTAEINKVVEKLTNGTLKVFDCSTFTLVPSESYTLDSDGHLTSYTNAFGVTGECIKTEGTVKYFNESVLRSAPYFDLDIVGIRPEAAAA